MTRNVGVVRVIGSAEIHLRGQDAIKVARGVGESLAPLVQRGPKLGAVALLKWYRHRREGAVDDCVGERTLECRGRAVPGRAIE